MKLLCVNQNLLGRTIQVGGGLGSITVSKDGKITVSPAHAAKLLVDQASWRKEDGVTTFVAPAPMPPPMPPPRVVTKNVLVSSSTDAVTGESLSTYERRPISKKTSKKKTSRRRPSESEE